MVYFLAAVVVFLATPQALGSTSSSITYHGRIIRPNNTAIEGTVKFAIQIRTPGTENCLLYEEIHEKVISNGLFALVIGQGNKTSGPDLEKVFQNRGTYTNLPDCKDGEPDSYTPDTNHGRRLRLSFLDPETGKWEQIPDTTISFVPFAVEAQSVGGFNAKHLLRVVGPTGEPEEVSHLTKTQFDNLLDWLTNGLPTGSTGGVSEVTALAPLSVTNGTTTPQISISPAGPGSDGYLTSTDWNSFNSKQPAGNYITALTGDVVASGPGSVTATIQSNAVTTGKIANEAVTFEKIQNITSGRILGRSSVTNGPIEEIQIGANLSLSGGVLSAASSGTVTSVTSTNNYISVTDTTTDPKITLNVGTTANTVAAGDDSRIVNAVQKTGDSMTGLLQLPANGLRVGSDLLVVSSDNVGIGTASPVNKLTVNGSVGNASSVLNATSTIDFSKGNIQYTNANCGTFDLHNLKDGTSYMFVVKGTTPATCQFNAHSDAGSTPLTVHMPG